MLLLSIGVVVAAGYLVINSKKSIVVDAKLSAYRARKTKYADRDEAFAGMRRHFGEEQGKRRYFNEVYPIAFAPSEINNGDPMLQNSNIIISTFDSMLIERGAKYGAIPNNWNELTVQMIFDSAGEENAYASDDNILISKFCELKRKIEKSPGYEESCQKYNDILYYYPTNVSDGTCFPPWSIFNINAVYMNVNMYHNVLQVLKDVLNDDDDDDEKNGSENITEIINRLPTNLIGNLSVKDWVQHAEPSLEDLKLIREIPSFQEEIEHLNNFACNDLETIQLVKRSLRGLNVFATWSKKWEDFKFVYRPFEAILDYDALNMTTTTISNSHKGRGTAFRLIFQRKKENMALGVSEADSIYWIKNTFEKIVREWGNEKSIRVSWRHWDTYSELELEQLAKDSRWISAAFSACFFLVLFHTGSFIVTITSCIVVVSSLVLAIFSYVVLLDKTWVGVLHFLGVFVILAVGADDAFVLVDHWKLSAKLIPVQDKDSTDAWLIDRMTWTIQKSFFAISCTSATTTTAFATLIFSSIEPLRLFGIFAALSVIFCFVVTIAMVPASLCMDAWIYEKRLAFFAIVNAPGGRSSKVVPRRFKVVREEETDEWKILDVDRNLFPAEDEAKKAKELDRIENGTGPSSLLPRASSRRSKSYGGNNDDLFSSFESLEQEEVVTILNTEENTTKNHPRTSSHRRAKSLGNFGKDESHLKNENSMNNTSLNRVKRVLEPINDALTRVDTARRAALTFTAALSESVGKFSISKRYAVLVIAVLLSSYEAYVASTLKPPDGSTQSIWPSEHNSNVFAEQNRQYFYFAKREESIPIQFVFGVDAKRTREATGFDKTLRFENTKVVFSENFNDAEILAQEWLLNFCKLLKQDERILKPSLKCFSEELDAYARRFRYPNRVPFNTEPMYEKYVEDFVNDAIFRFGQTGLNSPHVISTDACALQNVDAYGFLDKTVVAEALKLTRISLQTICDYIQLNGDDLSALSNVPTVTNTTTDPEELDEDTLRALGFLLALSNNTNGTFSSASAYFQNTASAGTYPSASASSSSPSSSSSYSGSLFSEYFSQTGGQQPQSEVKLSDENRKTVALACSKMNEEPVCKRAITISASINVSGTSSQQEILNARADWERWFEEVLLSAPESIRRGDAFQTSPVWAYADTVEELTKGAKQALIASFLLAFVVAFIASRSVAIAFATCFSVAAACACTLGFAKQFLHWRFGVIESICISLIIGLSVDYPLHIASAYAATTSSASSIPSSSRTPSERRAQRATLALEKSGTSIFGGAATTVSAAGFLLGGCVIVFFTTFGAFVVFTLLLSVLSSLVVLTALLASIGPP